LLGLAKQDKQIIDGEQQEAFSIAP